MCNFPMLIEVAAPDFERFHYYYCRIMLNSPRNWSMEILDAQQTHVGQLEVERGGDELTGDALVKAVKDWAWLCVGHRTGFFPNQTAPENSTVLSIARSPACISSNVGASVDDRWLHGAE
jgi:hypothetical protein